MHDEIRLHLSAATDEIHFPLAQVILSRKSFNNLNAQGLMGAIDELVIDESFSGKGITK